jgi:acetyl esterase/lipase
MFVLGQFFHVLSRRLFRGPKHAGWPLRFEVVVEIARTLMRRGFAAAAGSGRMAGGRGMTAPVPAALRERVRWQVATHADLPAEIHTPLDWTPAGPTMLYLHGGGYVTCSPRTHRALIARIAAESGARCVAVEYRKAPAHPFPCAIDDCVRAYRELLASGVAPASLFVGGDSAGGGLTLATLQRLRVENVSLPRAAILLSPWVDLEGTGASVRDNAPYDYLSEEMLSYGASVYVPNGDRRDPLVSAVHAELRGLPPLLVQTGSAELFASENAALVERARAHGVEVVHEVEPGMVHVFQALAQFAPVAADRAFAGIGRFVRDRSP